MSTVSFYGFLLLFPFPTCCLPELLSAFHTLSKFYFSTSLHHSIPSLSQLLGCGNHDNTGPLCWSGTQAKWTELKVCAWPFWCVCAGAGVCVCKDIKKCINACLTAGGLVLYKRVCIMQHWTVCQVMQWNEWPGKLPISLDPHSAHFSTSLTLLQFSVLLSVVS